MSLAQDDFCSAGQPKLAQGGCQHWWVLYFAGERLWCPSCVSEEPKPKFDALFGIETLAYASKANGNLPGSCPSLQDTGCRLILTRLPARCFIPRAVILQVLHSGVSYALLTQLFLAVLGKFLSCRGGNSCLSSTSSRGGYPWCILVAGWMGTAATWMLFEAFRAVLTETHLHFFL